MAALWGQKGPSNKSYLKPDGVEKANVWEQQVGIVSECIAQQSLGAGTPSAQWPSFSPVATPRPQPRPEPQADATLPDSTSSQPPCPQNTHVDGQPPSLSLGHPHGWGASLPVLGHPHGWGQVWTSFPWCLPSSPPPSPASPSLFITLMTPPFHLPSSLPPLEPSKVLPAPCWVRRTPPSRALGCLSFTESSLGAPLPSPPGLHLLEGQVKLLCKWR